MNIMNIFDYLSNYKNKCKIENISHDWILIDERNKNKSHLIETMRWFLFNKNNKIKEFMRENKWLGILLTTSLGPTNGRDSKCV